MFTSSFLTAAQAALLARLLTPGRPATSVLMPMDPAPVSRGGASTRDLGRVLTPYGTQRSAGPARARRRALVKKLGIRQYKKQVHA